MGVLNKLFGTFNPINVMRADLFMEYHPLTSNGIAAMQWVYLDSKDLTLRPFLVVLLYARILYAHSATRAKLFELVDLVSKQNVRDEGRSGFKFPEWKLTLGFGTPEQRIWPFTFVDDPTKLTDPKIYSATLQAYPKTKQWSINLKMALGQERILAPASALIALCSYSASTDQEGRYELAFLLWQLNEYYRSPGLLKLGSESKALAAATGAMRRGGIKRP